MERLMLVIAAAAAVAIDPMARTVSSDGGLRLSKQPSISWRAAKCPENGSVRIQASVRHQTMGGFGASMTESSAINLNSLPTTTQEELLGVLFGPTGAWLSAMKATMLSNDFAAQAPWSTYDDTAGDVALANFSIARDLRPHGSLTLIKRAIAAGFEGTIQAYMDWPPDWMLAGTPPNATVNPVYYEVLARYYAKYVQAYASHGVKIDFLECFNEPFDSYTQIGPAEFATFLGEHIGPLFDQLGLRPGTKLTYGGQCSRSSAYQFVNAVMADPAAARYMDVIAYHGYDCQLSDADNPQAGCDDARQKYHLIGELAQRYGSASRQIWMTEICYAYYPLGREPACKHASTLAQCGEYPRDNSLAPPLPRRDFADGTTWGHRIAMDLQAGASGWIYWNLLLDSEGGPYLPSDAHSDPTQNFQHPLVIVDRKQGSYHLTGLYFFLAHFAKFVRPGAVRIGATVSDDLKGEGEVGGVDVVAFVTGTGAPASAGELEAQVEAAEAVPGDASTHDVTVQLINTDRAAAKTVDVCTTDSAGRSFVASVELPAASITTAQWVQGVAESQRVLQV